MSRSPIHDYPWSASVVNRDQDGGVTRYKGMLTCVRRTLCGFIMAVDVVNTET